MAMERPPTAIVFAVDAAALGAYDAAGRLGLEVGRDLSVIGYDGIPEGRWVRPSLTTFSVDSRESGARLSALLIALVRGASVETLRETRDAKLQIGGSDGPPFLYPARRPARVCAIVRTHKPRHAWNYMALPWRCCSPSRLRI